jgi:rSAM/selenodomain-associated transferase 1
VRVALAVMAKAARPGEVKTRLAPALGPEGAAELYRCFLVDLVDRLTALAGATPAVAYAPADAGDLFRQLAPGFALLPQRGGDLGERLSNLFDDLFAAGHGAALVIGSDLPTLPDAILADAVARVRDPAVDLVLGPSEDGGYYLIGMRERRPCLFEGVAWSTDRVLAETRERADGARLRTALLPRWFDVDEPADLDRLRASLAGPEGSAAPRTRRLLLGRG